MSHSTPERIVIVGGGFAGVSLAARLAQSGLPVTLLEAAALGFDASSRNQGWLYSGGWFARAHRELARMCHDSLLQTVRYCPDCLEPDHDGMFYVFSRLGAEHLQWKNDWTAAGIPFTEVARDELAQRLPGLDMAQVQHAYLLPDRAFRPQILLERLAAEARNAGAEIRTHVPVVDLLRKGERIEGVRTGSDEEIRARATILATGAWDWSAALMPVPDVGRQTEYTRVALKTHLVAFRPEIGRWPLCVVDREGFNHMPHAQTSVFGSGRWRAVHHAADLSVDAEEVESIWSEIQRFFPAVDRSDVSGLREWAGTAAQMMHVDQVQPGEAPLPTVIDHSGESPRLDGLWSVSPGRASLWARLAEEAREKILDRFGDRPLATTAPPWAIA